MLNSFLIANSSVMALIGNKGPHIMPGLFGSFADIINNFFEPFFKWLCEKILGGVFGIYESVYDLKFGQFYNTNTIIPGLNAITSLARAIAWGLIFAFLVTALLKAIAGPITGGQQPNPINMFGRIIIVAAFLVIYGNLIHRMVLIGDDLLDYVRGDFATAIGLSTKISDITIDWSSTSNLWANNIIGLIFCVSLAYNIIMASINQGERFIMFGIYTTICPIPIAFIADDSNSDIPKNYFMTLFSQMLAIMFNMIIFSLLSVKLKNFASASGGIVDWIVCIGLASVASHSENLINAIGLKSMPTPQAASDFMSGARGAIAAAGTAVGATAATAKAIGTAGHGVGHLFGLNAPLSGNKYDPAQSTTRKAASSTSGTDDKLITKKNAEIKEGRQAGKTGYVKGEGLTAPRMSTAEEKKQTAYKHGEINNKQNAVSNALRIAHTGKRMDEGYNQRRDAIDKINDIMLGERLGHAPAPATGKDLSTALNLEKAMPNVDFNNDKLIRKNSDGTLTATGYINKTDANGNVYREAKEFTFGDRDTISKAGLGSEFRPVTEEGNFGMVTDFAHTADLDKLSKVDTSFLNTTAPKPGQNIEQHSSGEWVDNTFKLSDRLGGNVSIDHAAKIDNDYASIGTVTNKDGTQSQKLYYTTNNADLIQNGGYANGLMLDNSKIVNNGNGYYTMEATWADQKEIDNKGDNAITTLSQEETKFRILNEGVPDATTTVNSDSYSDSHSNTSDNTNVGGADPTVEDKKGIDEQIKKTKAEMDEEDRASNKPGAKKGPDDPD